jgi:hypothetical protein
MDHTMSVEKTIERELLSIPGWCTVEKGIRMAELARGASLCVELGVFGGRGLISMALALADQKSGRADGIDPFTPSAALEGTNDPANDDWWGRLDYSAIATEAQKAIYRLKLAPYAHLIRMRSIEVVGYYDDESISVLHQDSNHSEEISCKEVSLWASKIQRNGYWIFDDAHWPSTQKAQRELTQRGFKQLEDHTQWKVYARL